MMVVYNYKEVTI